MVSVGLWRGGLPDGADRLVRQLSSGTFLRVVVPSRTPAGRLLPLDRWKVKVLRLVLPLSGGATEILGRGHWLDSRRRLITEKIRILDVYLPGQLQLAACRALLQDLLKIAGLMEQEALAIVVGQRLYLLKPSVRPMSSRDTASRSRFLSESATERGLRRRERRVA